MAKLNPLLILQADMVTPRRVPGAVASTFDRLGNYLLPKLGIQIAFEFFETGWLSFFGSISDFRTYFGRPMFSKSRKASLGVRGQRDKPLIWDYKFKHLPPDVPEAMLGEILRKYYSVPGSLGEGSFEQVPRPVKGMLYRVTHPSLAIYITSVEEITRQAYNLYLSFRKNPKIPTKG